MRHPTKFGTVVADATRDNGYRQIVKTDDGDTFSLRLGIDGARDAQVGDRVEMRYIATRSLGLWYATKVADERR